MKLCSTISSALLASMLVFTAPADATSCVTGPFVLFFEAEAPFITKDARKTLDLVIDQVGGCGYGRTVVIGHTDTKEDSALARKRAEVVRDYMAAHGVPGSDIVVQSYGSTRPRVTTGPHVSEPRNRRVEIMVSQP